MAGVTKKVNFELCLIWLVATALDGEAQSLALKVWSGNSGTSITLETEAEMQIFRSHLRHVIQNLHFGKIPQGVCVSTKDGFWKAPILPQPPI